MTPAFFAKQRTDKQSNKNNNDNEKIKTSSRNDH